MTRGGGELAAPAGAPAPGWADRGWYLAIDYGVLSKRSSFARAHGRLRALGDYKELLDEEGRIVHRNLFRENELRDAWTALALLQPWRARLALVLSGEDVTYGEAHDVLWCAAFENEARTCLPRAGSESWTIGCDRVLDLSPRDFDHHDEKRRHLMTFAALGGDGELRFDRDAIRAFVASGRKMSLCPAAPFAALDALVEALPEAVAPSKLGWGAVLALDAATRDRLGLVLGTEHELDLLPRVDFPRLGTPLTLKPARRRKPAVDGSGRIEVLGPDARPMAQRVLAPEALFEVVEDKVVLRATITGGFYRRMRFLVARQVELPPGEPLPRGPARRGYEVRLVPRATPEYERFVRGLLR